MTEATFEKGQHLLDEIKRLKDTIYSLNSALNSRPEPGQKKNWLLRLTNRKKDSPDTPEHAGIILFNGISPYGQDIPVDESLVDCLKDFFEKRLEEKQREFNLLGDE